MQRPLLKHPGSAPSPISRIEADAVRMEDGRLVFMFMAFGEVDEIRVPPPGEIVRNSELWRHTCFEAFLAPLSGDAYFEFNLSPSRDWAAYRFDSYRSGMTNADVEAPQVGAKAVAQGIMLSATVPVGALPELVPWESWRLGLSAVIEAEDGSHSYWALAHVPGKPDFHHRDCFAAELAPAASL